MLYCYLFTKQQHTVTSMECAIVVTPV